MTEISEKEIEAAREAWREYWSDVIGQYDDNKDPMEGMRRALEAAARVRAEDNAGGGEPEGELCKCAPAFHEHDEAGAKHCRSCDAEWHPAPQPSGPVQVKPLEWSSRDCLHLAYSGFGTYRIEDQGSNWKEDRYWLDHNGERIGKCPTLEAAKSAAQADYEQRILSALTAGKPEQASGTDYFGSLVERARASATKASAKFPQPNYVTLKIAEEAGEVIRGAVHYAERRMEWSEVEGEIIQLLAMLIRFVTEGDQVNGIVPPTLPTAGGGE